MNTTPNFSCFGKISLNYKETSLGIVKNKKGNAIKHYLMANYIVKKIKDLLNEPLNAEQLHFVKLMLAMKQYNCFPKLILPPSEVDKTEYILCAANHFDNKKEYLHQPRNIKTGIVVLGRRHHNCSIPLLYLFGKNRWQNSTYNETQGFLTNMDRFVNRDAGLQIALRADQVLNLDDIRGRLFSEDLY